MKEERKSKAKTNKENQKSVTSIIKQEEPEDELPPIAFAPSPPKKDLKKEQEEKELLEVSLIDDNDDFLMEQLQKAEEVKPKPAVVKALPAAPKSLAAKPINVESTIFNELQGIDFDSEIQKEEAGKIDWTTVR